HPKDTRVTHALARSELLDGRRERTRKYLEEILQAAPTEAEELWSLASMLIEVGDLDRAEAVGKRLGQQGARAARDCLEAQILIQRDACGAARVQLEKLRPSARE